MEEFHEELRGIRRRLRNQENQDDWTRRKNRGEREGGSSIVRAKRDNSVYVPFLRERRERKESCPFLGEIHTKQREDKLQSENIPIWMERGYVN